MSVNLNPAKDIINRIGGVKSTASVCNVGYRNVYKWTYPKENGGTGGYIPSHHAKTLLTYAIQNNIDVKAEDFFKEQA